MNLSPRLGRNRFSVRLFRKLCVWKRKAIGEYGVRARCSTAIGAGSYSAFPIEEVEYRYGVGMVRNCGTDIKDRYALFDLDIPLSCISSAGEG